MRQIYIYIFLYIMLYVYFSCIERPETTRFRMVRWEDIQVGRARHILFIRVHIYISIRVHIYYFFLQRGLEWRTRKAYFIYTGSFIYIYKDSYIYFCLQRGLKWRNFGWYVRMTFQKNWRARYVYFLCI